MLIVTVLLPILSGALLPLFRFEKGGRRAAYVLACTCLTSLCLLYCLLVPQESVVLCHFSDTLAVTLSLDGLGKVFAALVAFLWPFASLYAFEYMEKASGQNTFFAFYTISFGVTLGVAMADNLLSLYVFYELLTFATLPLVMHGMRHEAVDAGLKYLYYSLGGAALAFIGLVFILYFGQGSTAFAFGGSLPASAVQGNETLLRAGYVLCFLGFGVKAAVFPLHGWLPSVAVAPTPVTALLHAVAVVKAGAFAIIRVTYYTFGAGLLAGTFAQYVPLALAIFTIVFGCVMAVRERNLKRRLAYSTVSNLSYILFGALLLTPGGMQAGLLHMVFHALMKITLFAAAGTVLEKTGKRYVSDLRGLSKRMPLTMAAFALGALAMTGVPPLPGFLSKWSLAEAALTAGGALPIIGLCALIVSALLTAGYLVVPTVTAWFMPLPENAELPKASYDPGWRMLVPFVVFCAAMLACSLYPSPLVAYLRDVAAGIL